MKIAVSSTKMNIIGILLCTMLLIFLAIIAMHGHADKESFIREMNSQCAGLSTNERQECLRTKILNYVQKDPYELKGLFDLIWVSFQKGVISDDARIFSPIVHDVGMLLFEKGMPLSEAVSTCGLSFRGGCIHGVFMEYVDTTYDQIDPDTLIHECVELSNSSGVEGDRVFRNCIHALGHELAAKGKGNLNEDLSMCTAVPANFRNDCAYGVFMEYSKGDAGSGHHSESPVGQTAFDCSSVDASFQKVCYTSAGFYKQYEVTSEAWEKTYRFCQSKPSEYQRDCFNGVGGAVLFSSAFVQERAMAVCSSLPRDVQDYCMGSI